MTYLAILGRIPAISIAELERVFGAEAIKPFSDMTALVETNTLDVQTLGGIIKAGRVVLTIRASSWSEVSKKIIQFYANQWSSGSGKQTLGISVYDWPVDTRDIQKTGIVLKSTLKKYGRGLRLIPNSEPILNTATSHHNKLGLSQNKTELIVVKNSSGDCIIAESVGAQNITALAARDQERPRTDAFVGMLPPKLALTMINLSAGQIAHKTTRRPVLLDPFCGTGVTLQEAALSGYTVYGTDLSDKMVEYSRQNIEWLIKKYHLPTKFIIAQGDAMDTKWQQPIDVVVAETYLGQPFSAPPRAEKLHEVRNLCNHIISSFLQNIAPQLKPGTPLCLAVPAWRDDHGRLTHLPLTKNVDQYGFDTIHLSHVRPEDMVYFRTDQVVARELLLIQRK